jgi:D-alanyl-D-alanine carboxypeptidase (penicillin-binding protein 5/6)
MALLLAPGVSAQGTLDVPVLTAASVYAFDPATGEVIVEQNADERRPIGSVTKVVTALVVADHLAFDERITIAGTDMVEPGYSAMGLQPGDTLTVEQLLTGLLVVSGGDAAWALARTVGMDLSGSDDADAATAAFVEAMNDKAAELGVADSRFANPDGADDDDAYATAHDVARLYAALESNSTLAGIAAETEYAFTSVGPEATPYNGTTTNQLAGTHGVLSAKTGAEIDAGGCIVLSREAMGGGTIIVAVLGSTLEYDETTWTPTVDERWNDAVAVMGAIDAGWTPGQNLAAPATEAPQAAAPALASTGNGRAEAPPRAQLVDAVPASGSRADPLLVVTITSGVLACAAVFGWSRVLVPRNAVH